MAFFALALFHISNELGRPLVLVRYGSVNKKFQHIDAIKESVKAGMAPEEYAKDNSAHASKQAKRVLGTERRWWQL